MKNLFVDSSDLTVIIPTYNEEKNIGRLIDRIVTILPSSKVIVVDDGSTDNTQQLVKERVEIAELVDRSKEEIKGLSISILEGILRVRTKYLMIIDGDFQHPPDSLLEAITCLKKEPDLVIGYRIKVENWPLLRKAMSWGAQKLASLTLLIKRRQRPKDTMSGFFGGNTIFIQNIIESANIGFRGYKILFDILKILPKDSKICQFGYIFRNREFGTSKIGRMQIWEFVKSLFK